MGERRGPSRVAGPSDAGAAMTMGNSLEMWDRVYDTNFKAREVQAAVDAMDQWRAGLVGKMGVGAREPELLAQGTLHEMAVGLTSLAEESLEGSEDSQEAEAQSQDSHESEPEYEDSEEGESQSQDSHESELEYEDSQGEEQAEGSMEVGYDDSPVEGEEEEEEEEWEDDDVVVEL